MTNVLDMKVQKRLIEEAREARAKRKAERETDNAQSPQYPGGIDDIKV